jgi:hypothetical protein
VSTLGPAEMSGILRRDLSLVDGSGLTKSKLRRGGGVSIHLLHDLSQLGGLAVRRLDGCTLDTAPALANERSGGVTGATK